VEWLLFKSAVAHLLLGYAVGNDSNNGKTVTTWLNQELKDLIPARK